MKALKDYSEYLSYKEMIRGVRYLSNCYFLPEKVKEEIAEGKLYVDQQGENIYLYQKEDGFYRLYYWVTDKEAITKISSRIPIVIEIPYSGNIFRKKSPDVEVVEKMGFSLGRESSQMSVLSENVIWDEQGEMDANVRFDFARVQDCKIIKEMLYTILNPLYAFLPDDRHMEKLIENRNILIAYYGSQIAGVLNVEIRKKTAWTMHEVVAEGFRGKEIGGRLFEEGHRIWKDKVKDFKCWVDVHNIPSVKMHEKYGYEFDDKKANEYILKL